MTIEERLEKIEKQNRNMKKWLAGVAALALAALIGGTALSVRAYTAAIEPDSITTKSITLKDGAGVIRVILSGAFGLVDVKDANGKLRASMRSSGHVFASDTNGTSRVILNASDSKIYFRNDVGTVVAQYP